jgi:hypothetical protein
MNTIWEWAGTDFGDIVDAVPATEDVLSAEDGSEGAPVRGCLWLRQSSILPIRLFAFGRRPFQQRYAVLSGSGSDGRPRLQLYLVSGGVSRNSMLCCWRPAWLVPRPDCMARHFR